MHVHHKKGSSAPPQGNRNLTPFGRQASYNTPS